MKIYNGQLKGHTATVTVNGVPLDPRLDLWNHSPDGFGWGYTGARPAQLALALLADCLGDEIAVSFYYPFMCLMVADLPESHAWSLMESEIQEVLERLK